MIKKLKPDDQRLLMRGWQYVKEGAAVVAGDPSSSEGRFGWCVRWIVPAKDGLAAYTRGVHGQDTTASAAESVLDLLGDVPIGLMGIEEPHGRGRGRNANVYLPWAAGEFRGRLAAQMVDDRCLWRPLSQVWRAEHGLNRNTEGDGDSAAVNEHIHNWSSAHAKHPMVDGEALEIDRANAYALCFTMISVCERLEEQRRKTAAKGEQHVRSDVRDHQGTGAARGAEERKVQTQEPD